MTALGTAINALKALSMGVAIGFALGAQAEIQVDVKTCAKALKQMGMKCEYFRNERSEAVFLCNFAPVPNMQWISCNGKPTDQFFVTQL